MFRKFGRHLRDGFYSVWRHAAMSCSSASAVTITLLIISVFFMFTYNVQSITKEIESSVQISAMIDLSVTEQQSIDQLNLNIAKIPGVEEVVFSSKKDELNYYINSFDSEDEKKVFEPYLENNPMHDAFYITIGVGEKIDEIAGKIEAFPEISSVNYGGDNSKVLIDALGSIRNGGLFIVVALSVLAIFLIYNTIKLTIFARADEIWIMRNVGARNGYIRAPFVIEGIIIGAIGAIIPILATVFGYIFLYQQFNGVLVSKLFIMVPPHPFVLYVSLMLLGVGMLVGLVGSFLSVTKYLRWKR